MGFWRDWWNGRRRRLDLEILWPECRRLARDLPSARRAFEAHVVNDPAWTCLGDEHVKAIIEALD
jgi:hypothetical protein